MTLRSPGAYSLNGSHRPAVEELRLASLVRSGTFTANPEAVTWSESDDRSTLLGITSETGVLLATMRAELLSTPQGLREKLDYDHLHEAVDLPCGLFGKASTRHEARGLGLNTYLQYLGYRHFRNLGVRHIAATIMPNSVYASQLRKLGFTFIENPEGWRRFGYQSNGMTYVIYLDLERRFDQVMSALEPKIRDLREKYPFFPVTETSTGVPLENQESKTRRFSLVG